MELSEFVRDSLVQIASGVRSAVDEVAELGGSVNPSAYKAAGDAGENGVSRIEFDVQLTIGSSGSAGAKVKVFSAFEVSAGTQIESALAHRIRFSVPLRLPAMFDRQ